MSDSLDGLFCRFPVGFPSTGTAQGDFLLSQNCQLLIHCWQGSSPLHNPLEELWWPLCNKLLTAFEMSGDESYTTSSSDCALVPVCEACGMSCAAAVMIKCQHFGEG